jgi:DNA/RNA-binding domain of Phe-tRNA-synthetase-like protein
VLQSVAERGQLGSSCGEHAAVELEEDPSVLLQPPVAGSEETAVRLEAVAWREDGGSRLVSQVGIPTGIGCRNIGQVRHHQVDPAGHRIEEITVANDDSIVDSVKTGVPACERDGAAARVGGKHVNLRRGGGDGNRDRPGAGADFDDAGRAEADTVERRSDQLFARPPRRHHATGSGAEGRPAEADVGHISSVSRGRRYLRGRTSWLCGYGSAVAAELTLFRYDSGVLERFPGIVGGVVHVRDVENGPSPPRLLTAYRVEQEDALARIGEQPPGTLPSLAAWRRTFTAFGVEPTRYRSAAEALLRRLTKHGEIPSVGLLVDIGNLVSVRYLLPVAVLDLTNVAGGITVRLAEGGEEYTDLGATIIERPDPGEVVFVDEVGVVHARRWCWRQSGQSATGPTTNEILIAVEGLHETAADDVAAALADLEHLLADHSPGATLERALLTARDPSFPA